MFTQCCRLFRLPQHGRAIIKTEKGKISSFYVLHEAENSAPSQIQIPHDLTPGLNRHTGPVLIYFESGCAIRGFALRDDEFVTSLRGIEEAKKKAGLPAF